MALCLYKAFIGVLLLNLCHGQDLALPSPGPASALPSLVDVMESVKAAFMEAVKISKDDEARAVFEQVVEELGPQGNVAGKPPATRDDTEDGDKGTTILGEGNARQETDDATPSASKQTDEEDFRQGAGLGPEPGIESISQPNELLEELEREVGRDLSESTQEPKDSSEDKIGDRMHAGVDAFRAFEPAPEGENGENANEKPELLEAHEQTKGTNGTGGALEPKLATQTEVHRDRDLESDLERTTDDEEDEQGLVHVVGHVEESETEEEEDMEGEAAARIGEEDVRGPETTEKNSQELDADVMQETNDLNDIVMSRDPAAHRDVPSLGLGGRALPPSPTPSMETGESDELLEEPADITQSTAPRQEAWRIGVIAIALFLLLQSLVTVTYILKCRRKRSSCAVPERACEDGNGAVKNDEANAGPEEQITADLPERSQIQQETFTLTPIP